MIYASSNKVLKEEFQGIKHFEYHDEEEFNFQEMVKELRKKGQAVIILPQLDAYENQMKF